MTPKNQDPPVPHWGRGRTQESYEQEVRNQETKGQRAPVNLCCHSLLLRTLVALDLLRGGNESQSQTLNKKCFLISHNIKTELPHILGEDEM